jgi:hypothetical protein
MKTPPPDPQGRWILLIDRYRKAAEDQRRWRGESDVVARTLDIVMRDIEITMQADAEESLTLVEASRESGYSSDHLGRLIREGKLGNAGRTHAPRIRRADLPIKPAYQGRRRVAEEEENNDSLRGLFRDIVTSKNGRG